MSSLTNAQVIEPRTPRPHPGHSLGMSVETIELRATQIIYVKCSNYQAAEKCDHWQINVNPPLIREEVSLIFRRPRSRRSLTSPGNFEPSENQATKKWKWVFTPPPRKTDEVIIPAFPWACPGLGEGLRIHKLIPRSRWNFYLFLSLYDTERDQWSSLRHVRIREGLPFIMI